MKTLLSAAAIVAALTLPALAEGELTGTEAAGEANGSFKLSVQEPKDFLGSYGQGSGAMAQGLLPRQTVSVRSSSTSGAAASSGMDGGNRK